MFANAGQLVRCSLHSARGECWINFGGKHVLPERCTCMVAGTEGWECPIDAHAQRWRNENPEHGRPFLRRREATNTGTARLDAAEQKRLFRVGTPRRLGVGAAERRAKMAEHYTLATVEVSAWCAKCRKNTMHRVDGRRKGPCKVCMEKLDNAPKVVPPEKQERLW